MTPSTSDSSSMQPDPQPGFTPEGRVIITICTYNERDNLPRLLEEIHRYLPTAAILVLDDNSPDGTGQLAEQIGAQDARVTVQHRVGQRGLGTATLAAFQAALQQDYDFLINLDADFSHQPRHLPELIQALQTQQADVAIGSRYIPGGKIQGWPWKRHMMSRCINYWSRCWLGLKIHDCSGSYRCYRTALLRQIDFQKMRSQGYSVQEELLFRCARAGARFVEVPIVFLEREQGESKINWREATSAVKIIALCGTERLRS